MPRCVPCDVRGTDPVCWCCGQPWAPEDDGTTGLVARSDTTWVAMGAAMRAAWAADPLRGEDEDTFLGWVGL